MNQFLLSILALFGGVCLAIQACFNTQLGIFLKKPIFATISTSVSSLLFAFLFIFLFSKGIFKTKIEKDIPIYLWFAGGLFSVVGITIYYFVIPRLGIAKMISLGLCGQLIFSVVVGYFGWLNLPQEPITFKKIFGVLAMLFGIICINLK